MLNFKPSNTRMFFLSIFLTALIYGTIGVLVGNFVGKLGGSYIMFLFAMVDVGFIQNPMFPRSSISQWMKALPGYHPTEILIDVSFTKTFDTGLNLVLIVIYFIVLWMTATAVFYKNTKIS